MYTMPAPTVRLLLLKSGAGSGAKIAHQGGYAKYGNPPRWHAITADKPAPKGAPVAAHPKAAGHHEPAAHFSDDQWAALKLPDSNVNASTFNGALAKLKAWSDAGDVTAILGAGYGVNTYGQRLVKLANHLLGLHGSPHKVVAGQKAGAHSATLNADPAAPHPSGLPEHIAPKVAEPTPPTEVAHAEGDKWVMPIDAAVAEHKELVAAAESPSKADDKAVLVEQKAELGKMEAAQAGALAMPAFEEGKTTTGVVDYYTAHAQKVMNMAAAGDVAGLKKFKADGMKPNAKGKVSNTWAGKTANSKKLLALHAAALAHAGGGAPSMAPEPVVPSAQPEPTAPRLVLPKKASAVPAGWNGSPSGLITKPGDAGGIVDKNAVLGWFAIPHSDPAEAALKGKFFTSQAEAVAALDQAVAGAVPEPAKPKLPPHLVSLAAKMSGQQPGATVTDVTPAGYGPEPEPDTITVPEKLGKVGPTTFKPAPDFKDYAEAQAWIASRAKALGMSKASFQSSYEYAHAMPKLQAAYAPAKADFDAKMADKKAEALAAMSDAGVKLGDTVAWNSVGAFLSQTKYEGTVVMHGGLPHVKLAHKTTVSKGGKLVHTNYLLWQPHMKPKGAAVAPGPKEGDTKPAADGGTLVLKDGHWVKQGGDAAPVAPATQAAPAPTTAPLTAEQLSNLQSIPWYKLKLPDSNSNAKSHNAAVAKIEAMAFAGDVAGLKAFADKKAGAKQTYAKKQHLLAMSALDFLNGNGPTAEQKVRAAKVAAPPEPDKYPVVTEWKAAIVAGKVPTKAQAEAYEALGKHDPAAQSEYFLDAVADSIPKSVPVDGDEFDAAYKAANEKVGELHGHALAGTKPGDKPAAVTADTPLTDGQLLALESFSLDELKALDGGPNLPPNVQAWVGKKLADQAAADSVPAYPKKMIDGYAASGDWSGVQMIIDNSPTPSVVAYAKQVLAGKPTPKPTRLVAKPAPSQAIPSNGPEAADALEKLENDIGSAGSATEATKIAWDYVNLSGLTSAAYSDAADALMAHGYSAAAQGFATNSKNVKDYNTGPKEGDTKQGADGMLVLKNGHWVKVEEPAPAAPAIKKLTPGQAIKIMASVSAKTAAGNKTKMKAMAVAGDVAGLQAFAEKKNYPASKAVAKKLIEAMTGGVAVPPASGTPTPAPAAPTTPHTVNGLPSMDNWVKTGPQGGSNPGGKFKDPSGQEWYCKFPKDSDTAKSEVLAAKLYALAGLSAQDCMLVSKGGKTAIATKWVNIQKAPSPAALAAADGALAGFAVDAWLGNWDVVGLAFDNLQIGPDGKAHRVDAGGSLEYRAQGEKKPFGPKVDELETLRDAGKNAQAAAVFKGMTKADMTASAAKVLAISDVAIRAMVNQYGPGDAAAKAKLAETLIARKKDIAAKFPEAAKKKKAPTFKPEDISAPPSFLNWGGSGKSGPSSKEFLNKANEDAVQAIFAAAKTGDVEAVKKLTAPVFDKGTGAVTGQQSVLYHPSQHVSGYAQQAINELNYQLNPPKQFRFDGGHPLHSLNAAYPSHKGAPSSAAAQKLGKFIALGDPGVIALADLALPAKITHAEGGGTLSVHTYAKQAQAAIAKMPATQKQAVKSYTGNSYHAMNGSLWDGNPTGAAKAAGEALHTLGHDIEPGTILSRHLSLHGKDLNDILGSVGKVLQEPAIMSTSIRPSSWIRNVQFKLHVGPGVKGLWVGYNSLPGGEALSKNAGEDEMVLPPGTRLLVLSVRKGGKDADGFGAHGQQHVIEAIILPTE